jgi:hypothetical protein
MTSELPQYCAGDLEIVPLSAVQHVAKRPAMFTPTGSIGEVFSFFRDYDPSNDGGATMGHKTFRDAVEWIGSECDFEPFSSNLDEVVAKIEGRFGCRAEFLSALVERFPPK